MGTPSRLGRKHGLWFRNQKLESFCKSREIKEDLTSHHREAAKYLERQVVMLGCFPKIKKEWLFEEVEDYRHTLREDGLSPV